MTRHGACLSSELDRKLQSHSPKRRTLRQKNARTLFRGIKTAVVCDMSVGTLVVQYLPPTGIR